MSVRRRNAVRTLLASVATFVMLYQTIAVRAQQTQRKSSVARANDPSRGLRKIGEAVAQAVLDKDIPALLIYDRADLRGADEISLKNVKSDLYCYIFDSECITWGGGEWRSVYDKLTAAHPLEIKAIVARSRSDRQVYGSIFFYEGSGISEKDLRSRDFVCKQGPAKLASWKFRLENGKWRAVTPLFDSETRDCPSDVQGDGQ